MVLTLPVLGHNVSMVEYEYLVLSFGREVGRGDIRRQLTEHAEYGRWELERTRHLLRRAHADLVAAPHHPAAPLDERLGLRGASHDAAPARQQLCSSRSSTRVPKCSDSTGTRSSMPWNIGAKSRSAGSRSGANP